MRVLVTGSGGLIGSAIVTALHTVGHSVIGFDRANAQDILDKNALIAAARGCRAILHLAALLGRPGDSPEEILAVNLLGTWNVLAAAEKVGAERIVFYSSVNALGVFMGERPPDYLPIDDEHPCVPSSPYGVSKLLAEQMCRVFTLRTRIPTICLRPPAVFDDSIREEIEAARRRDPTFEWSPFWEYGAFLDVRDAAAAGLCALTCPDPGHATMLLCAEDISSAEKTSRDLVRLLHPGVPWRGGEAYAADPYRSLLDTSRARQILGWEPRVRWRGKAP